VSIAAIVKVGVPSASSGYGAADEFSDDRIDAIRQRTCQGYAFAWRAFFSDFKLLTPKVHGIYRKIRFSKFRYKRIHAHTDSRILANFSEIGA